MLKLYNTLTRTKEDILQFESSIKTLEKEISEQSTRTPQFIHDIETTLSEISRTKITLKI